MKKISFDKIMKYLGIATIIVLIFLYSQERSNKSAKQRDDIYEMLISASEELSSISNDCFETYNIGNYQEMSATLYDAYTKLEKISYQLEDLSNMFQEHEYDHDERRSWFY